MNQLGSNISQYEQTPDKEKSQSKRSYFSKYTNGLYNLGSDAESESSLAINSQQSQQCRDLVAEPSCASAQKDPELVLLEQNDARIAKLQKEVLSLTNDLKFAQQGLNASVLGKQQDT